MSITLPRFQSSAQLVDSNGYPTMAFHIWWDTFAKNIEAALNAQQSQLDTITAILDPNTLTPDKKPVWIFMDSYLTGEQSDLDAKATTYGITTEKTNYDTALSALATYLATLTTPVAWNDTSGNTTITDVTFRGKFTDVLTTKQFLINKITDQAKVLADAAQGTATTAQSTATTAVTNAATAQTTANTANTTANTANTTANTANTTANTVKRNDAITVSYTAPGTVLTATDAGSDSTVTIANHNRVYGDNTTVAVTGASLTGLAYTTTYYIYYDQTSRAGGTVTYHADTNINHALPNQTAGRHFVGKVVTPASGGGATTGGAGAPSGGSGVDKGDITSTL